MEANHSTKAQPGRQKPWQNLPSLIIELVVALILLLAALDSWAGLMPEKHREFVIALVVGFFVGDKFAGWKTKPWRSPLT